MHVLVKLLCFGLVEFLGQGPLIRLYTYYVAQASLKVMILLLLHLSTAITVWCHYFWL